jgi:branched-chain amino acid transport system ATP-binding protein
MAAGVADYLHFDGVSKHFGGLKAVSDVTLRFPKGILAGIIGPNGAGKTTLFNLVTGVYRPTAGRILLDGVELSGHPPHQVARRGVGRTFQNIRLFGDLSALDNVRAACLPSVKTGLAAAVLRSGRFLEEEAAIRDRAGELLSLLRLERYRDALARNLPYGEQRRLEMARALALRPRLLLLDEPAAGMNPQETDDLMHLIRSVRDRFELTILLVEHDMRVVTGICEHVAVLDYGVLLCEGTPGAVCSDPRVVEAYLGEAVA